MTADGGSGKAVRADEVKFVLDDAEYPAPPVPSLTGHWKVEQNTNDDTGTNSAGTLYGGASYSSDMKEGSYSLTLDGSDDYINVNTLNDFPKKGEAFSMAAWVKPTESVSQWKSIMHVGDKDAAKFIEFRAVNGKFRANYYTGADDYYVESDSSYTTNTWYHLVLTFDGYQLKLWVDGTAQNSGNGVTITPNYSSNLRFDIGRCYEQRATALYWPGKVDEVRIYNYALSPSGIYYICNFDAKGHWKFDETSGTSAADSSGNERTGTVYGGASWNSNGWVNGCLEFDGTDDYVEVADDSNLDVGTSDFAISLWFYRHANATGNLRVLSKGAEYGSQSGYCIFGGDSQVCARLHDGTNFVDSSAVNHSGINAWTHMIVNFDRDGDMSIYINGTCATTADISSISGSNIDSSYALRIGRSSTSGLYWDGLVDEVRVFKRLLTYNEILALYNE